MGCWGMGIMQSDDALDAQTDIYETACSSWNETDKKKIQKEFLENYEKIAQLCNRYKEVDNYSYAVYWQVLAYEGMKNGVQFTPKQQKEIIEGITSCNEYKQGKSSKNKKELHEKIKNNYIKEYGLKHWEDNEKLWGEGSTTQRVIDRTKHIQQLVDDFQRYTENNFIPFERKELGLMQTFNKKSKKKM